ncbi:MAG: hypothetical protein CSA23_07580 [Deltaproteobacteria bacterium]|nr:MAG: hypothetical protein CSA23_07580 [Deltaproteobacteria bacterium]
MHNYNIPTKRDIDRLNDRLDRLEALIKALPSKPRRTVAKNGATAPKSATDTVMDLIRREKDGIGVAAIRKRTGYDDKKLRNIIFRLNQMGKIERVSRGSYKIAE